MNKSGKTNKNISFVSVIFFIVLNFFLQLSCFIILCKVLNIPKLEL